MQPVVAPAPSPWAGLFLSQLVSSPIFVSPRPETHFPAPRKPSPPSALSRLALARPPPARGPARARRSARSWLAPVGRMSPFIPADLVLLLAREAKLPHPHGPQRTSLLCCHVFLASLPPPRLLACPSVLARRSRLS
jgi:hypothetical protein